MRDDKPWYRAGATRKTIMPPRRSGSASARQYPREAGHPMSSFRIEGNTRKEGQEIHAALNDVVARVAGVPGR